MFTVNITVPPPSPLAPVEAILSFGGGKDGVLLEELSFYETKKP